MITYRQYKHFNLDNVVHDLHKMVR